MKYVLLALLLPWLSACGGTKEQPSEKDYQKIRFDLSQLDDKGLQGPEGGKTALDYEFCIPRDEALRREVEGIDSTLVVQTAAGRIGCSQEQYLCIGNTHQARFRVVLFRLAALSYVERIEQTFWE